MQVQSLRTALPQTAGTLKKFRGSIHVQTQRQTQQVKAQVKQLVNFKG